MPFFLALAEDPWNRDRRTLGCGLGGLAGAAVVVLLGPGIAVIGGGAGALGTIADGFTSCTVAGCT